MISFLYLISFLSLSPKNKYIQEFTSLLEESLKRTTQTLKTELRNAREPEKAAEEFLKTVEDELRDLVCREWVKKYPNVWILNSENQLAEALTRGAKKFVPNQDHLPKALHIMKVITFNNFASSKAIPESFSFFSYSSFCCCYRASGNQ